MLQVKVVEGVLKHSKRNEPLCYKHYTTLWKFFLSQYCCSYTYLLCHFLSFYPCQRRLYFSKYRVLLGVLFKCNVGESRMAKLPSPPPPPQSRSGFDSPVISYQAPPQLFSPALMNCVYIVSLSLGSSPSLFDKCSSYWWTV